ncbi:MAG: glycosyltransferase family 39 protein [Betaproteobacteria bacterium]|nr:glycosyltransferase family 39 protein [Betaproteobacteria bacterium]
MTEASADPAPRHRFWVWYAAGIAAFVPTLWLHYVGEEAIFPIASLEMWFRGEWVRQILFGSNLQHNPLFNWIIIAICQLVGWEWMLQAARLVTISATVSAGLVLAWLARRVFGDRQFAAFAAIVYLMLADVALYRGWLAYVDPLFGFFAFSAMACLWVACRERRAALLALAVASLTLAFLTKAFTAYVFYGIAAFVLFLERDHRRFLLSPGSIVLHAAAVAAVAVWLGIVHAQEPQGLRMFREIVDKLGFIGLSDYLRKLVAYPVETALKLAPASFLAIYYAWRRKDERQFASSPFRAAAAIAALNYLPYWLAPQSHTRYLVPLYPLAALVFAWVIWNARPAALTTTLRWFVGLLALKLIFVLAAFPYYQKTYRGENHARVAREILERTAGHPLYNLNVTATGLSVVAHLDIWRLPAPPLVFPPAQWDSGFVIAYTPDPKTGPIVRTYRLGGSDLYLLCRGAACSAVTGDR